MFFLPFMVFFFLMFMFLLFFLFFLVKWGIIYIALEKLGISPDALFLLLFLSMLGSAINIPITRIKSDYEHPFTEVVSFFGIRYRLPPFKIQKQTVVAVNVGGAVIPVLLSLYLWSQTAAFNSILLATAIVTFVVYKLARPVPGIGIAIPMFIPPIVAAACALLFAREMAPRVAYISGTIGTLLGADIFNLPKIKNLNAPVVSIGGAGTFDGIFLTGIIAVLLA
ncbi:MAG: DUF1614 domain-containing protein [Thermodesulforhabdaceae bacterium]